MDIQNKTYYDLKHLLAWIAFGQQYEDLSADFLATHNKEIETAQQKIIS